MPNGTKPEKVRRVKEDGEPIPYFVKDTKGGQTMYRQDPRTVEGELAWPERFSRKAVEELKARFRSTGGTYAEACQLQQRPVPRGGGIFPRDSFIFLAEAPRVRRVVRGWDLAATASADAAFTVGVKMAEMMDGRWCILDVCRFQGTPMEVEQNMRRCAEQDGYGVPISIPQDPGQAGKAQKSHLAKVLAGFTVHFSLESGPKVERASGLASQAEAGNLCLVRAPWNDAFIAEAALFPNGKFLDQVDAASRAFAYLQADNNPLDGISVAAGYAIT